MTKKVISVNEDASLMECVDHMLKNNVKRLPVIGKDGKVVGILYERDVFFAITKAMLEENNPPPRPLPLGEGARGRVENTGGGK